LLDVLRDLLVSTKGRTRTISSADSAWVKAVHAAAPDLDAATTYFLARTYAAYRKSGKTTAELDLWLAFTPWRSKSDAQQYLEAVASGWASAARGQGSPAVTLNSADLPDGAWEAARRWPIRAPGNGGDGWAITSDDDGETDEEEGDANA
jgi:hypothetical protein